MDKGIKGLKEITVTEELCARHIGSGELAVYATPSMIALAEETAWRSVAKQLEEGQGTVGTGINISHLAPTPIGMKVRCETELVQTDGRKLLFSVKVFDQAGLIGEGTHERFIINNRRFQEKADHKI